MPYRISEEADGVVVVIKKKIARCWAIDFLESIRICLEAD